MRLTEREKEVLDLISEGLPSSEAGKALGVAKRTIDFHLRCIYKKLGVRNRIQALNKVRELDEKYRGGCSVKDLTPRQQDILSAIIVSIERDGCAPAIREIGKAFGIGSLRGVTCHLDALERKGYIERHSGPHGIKVLKSPDGVPMLLRFLVAHSERREA